MQSTYMRADSPLVWVVASENEKIQSSQGGYNTEILNMWVKHSAQCLACSPHCRNISCEYYLLNQGLWREGGWRGRQERAGRRRQVSWPLPQSRLACSERQVPSTLHSGTSLPWPPFSKGLFWRPWSAMLGQTSGLTAKGRGSAWTPGDREGQRVLSGRTPEPLPAARPGPAGKHPGGVTLSLAREFPGSDEKSQKRTQRAWPPRRGDRIPDKSYFTVKSMTRQGQGAKDTGWLRKENEFQGVLGPAPAASGETRG